VFRHFGDQHCCLIIINVIYIYLELTRLAKNRLPVTKLVQIVSISHIVSYTLGCLAHAVIASGINAILRCRILILLIANDRPQILNSKPRIAISVIRRLSLVHIPRIVRSICDIVGFLFQRRDDQVVEVRVFVQQDRAQRLHFPGHAVVEAFASHCLDVRVAFADAAVAEACACADDELG
jgi:hypothetical protein